MSASALSKAVRTLRSSSLTCTGPHTGRAACRPLRRAPYARCVSHPFEHGELYPELWEEISARGWAGLLFGAEHGGSEGGLLADPAVVMEALAASNLILWMPVLERRDRPCDRRGRPGHASRERWLRADRLGRDVPRARRDRARLRPQRLSQPDDRAPRWRLLRGRRPEGCHLGDRPRGAHARVRSRTRGEEGAPPQFTTVLVDPECARYRARRAADALARGRASVPADIRRGRDAARWNWSATEGQGLLALWPFTHIERLLTVGPARSATRRSCHLRGRWPEPASGRSSGKQPIGAEQATSAPARIPSRAVSKRPGCSVYRAAQRFDVEVPTRWDWRAKRT